MTWLARLSLANRAIVGLVTALLLIFGVISATSLRQELIPSLEVPILTVITPYPGASPDAVEQQVTSPIESAVENLDGVVGSSSTSTSGASVITLELEYGTDSDTAATDVERAIASLGLPEDAEPTVGSIDTDAIPVVQLAVSSNLPPDQLATALRDDVQPLLAGLEGVGEVTLSGIAEPQITIDVDPVAAAERGVSLTSVASVLQANGVRIPAGELDAGGTPLAVEVGTPITAVEQIADLYVVPGAAGPTAGGPGGASAGGSGATADPGDAPAPVRLGDIATVTSAPAPATGFTRTNGADSIGVGVTRAPNSNTVVVSEAVLAELDEISDLIGGSAQDVEVTVVFDQAPFIQQSVEDLTTEGALGLVFAVLVILGFLLSVRATVVTAVSIPLSVLLALIVLYLGDFTLNILTLGALTVAVGRVVDDSIVVIENIKRHIGYGGPRRPAILTAIREVAGAITASTITTVAVFAPIGLVGGQVGELFRPFAVTVTAALLASLIVSLTVVPVLASLVLKSPKQPAHAAPATDEEPAAARGEGVRLQKAYLPVLRAALARPVIALGVAVLVLVGTLALVPLLQTNFLGDAGGDTLSVTQELEPGTPLPEADDAARRVEDVLADTEGIESYQVTVGSGLRFGPPGLGGGSTQFAITLAEDADSEAVTEDLRDQLSDLGPVEQVGTVTVSAGQGGFGGTDVAVEVNADDAETLAEAAAEVEEAARGVEGLVEVRNNLAAEQAVVDVTVNRQAAAEQGLTEAQVGQVVATALRGTTAGSLTLGGVEQDVILRAGAAPVDVAALAALPVGTVTLGEVATVAETTTAPSIVHTDGERSAEITGRPEGEDLGAVTTDLQLALDDLDLPDGATAVIGGVSAEQGEAFGQLGIALLAAIAVVYLVMVLTFRSLLQPLILLVSIPFAATGALGLLLITGIPLGVPALIGMLMLIGIVVTNAIVLIDLVNQHRRDGQPVYEALIDGAAQRLRPILMTAVATIFALLPMAFGLTGGGAFISQPLAVVVIGGLITSTLLTLVLVPVLYLITERPRERRRGGPAVPAADGPDGPGPDEDVRTAAVPDPADGARVPVGAGVFAGSAPVAASTGFVPAGSSAVAQPAAGPAGAWFGASAAPSTSPAGGPGVQGLVTDRDGRALGGVAITVYADAGAPLADTRSDGDGAYVLPVAGPGDYLVAAQSGGREPVAEWVHVDSAPVRRDLAVDGPASITGTVRSATGEGVSALVTIVDLAGARVGGTRSDSEGRYLLAHVPEGERRLLVVPTVGRSATQRVTVPETGTLHQDVDLPSVGEVTGVIRTEAGVGVGGALATVRDAVGTVVATGRTATDGSFRFVGLPEGDYTVTATPAEPAVGSVHVGGDGRTAPVELGLAREYPKNGRH